MLFGFFSYYYVAHWLSIPSLNPNPTNVNKGVSRIAASLRAFLDANETTTQPAMVLLLCHHTHTIQWPTFHCQEEHLEQHWTSTSSCSTACTFQGSSHNPSNNGRGCIDLAHHQSSRDDQRTCVCLSWMRTDQHR